MAQDEVGLEADVVVIGAGAAGLSAALTASFGGATTVVLEEATTVGGMSRYAEGLFAVESRLQKKLKIGLTVEEAFRRHMNESHWEANARLVRTFMDKSSETIDWLEGLGVKLRSVARIYPDGPLVWHMMERLAGPSLINPLAKKAKADGIRILTETPATTLAMNNGKVAGVAAKGKNGESVEISCKTVVVASGGYQDNSEWVRKYCKAGSYTGPLMPAKQRGWPIQMAWDAGAAAEGLGVVQAFILVAGVRNLRSHFMHAGMQPYLWINTHGERFCDEGIVWQFPWCSNALARQPRAEAYCVFDEDTKELLRERRGVQYVIGEFVDPGSNLVDLDEEIAEGVREGNAFCSGSISELASQIGANEPQLQATIDEYNVCCETNVDFVFGKDRTYLRAIRCPKFYAIRLGLKILITDGGIKINDKAEVIDKQDKVIPGLYAAGCCAGGMVGSTYVVSTTGGSLGFAVGSGRMAGESVLRYLATEKAI